MSKNKKTIKELRKDCHYTLLSIWDKKCCLSCKYGNEDKIVTEQGFDRCGLHGFAYKSRGRCNNYKKE